MNADSNLYVKSRIIPPPRKIEPSRRGLFKLTAGCPVEITVPAGKAEPSAMLYEAFAGNWRIRPELSWKNGGQEIPVDGYQLDIKPDQCGIAASTPGGVLNAVKTMRQLAESERGVLTLSGWQLPCITVEDAPALPFRGIHLCCFPETPTWEMEKYIRLAAYYKFNYAIIEPWGVFRFESHPEFCWEETAMEKADFIRLAALAARLGVTLIPQMNLFGHATASRCGSGKHVLLDRHPEYAPLFEPDGWTWCISNPHTRKYLEDIVLELHDAFGRPPFFHIGCDEAYNAGSCSLCSAGYPEKLLRHLQYFHCLLAGRGARVMMWHDMLLCRDDPRWDGYIVCGHSSSGLADLYRKLPQDIIICDWQYGDPAREGKDPEWPTSHFFRQAGFDVLVCPWLERGGIESLGHLAAESGFFGLLETTWSRTHGSHDLETLFAAGAEAAWNPDAPVYPGIVRREYLNRHLREVTHDAGLGSYVQFGSIQHQIAPMPFGEV